MAHKGVGKQSAQIERRLTLSVAGLEITNSLRRLSSRGHARAHAAAPLTLTRRGVRIALTTEMVRLY